MSISLGFAYYPRHLIGIRCYPNVFWPAPAQGWGTFGDFGARAGGGCGGRHFEMLESEGICSLKNSKIFPREHFGVLDILESEAARRGYFGIGVH